MSLGDHLRELRNRLVKSVLAIVVCTIIAACFNKELQVFLMRPLPSCTAAELQQQAEAAHKCSVVAVIGVTTPFTLALKVSLTAGLLGALPVWLYQLWAFISPGLHRNERKYSLGFLAAGIPLFLGGAVCAYLLMPTTIRVLSSFTPIGAQQILPAEDYFNIATRMVLVFGAAFEFPLVLVMLNFTGALTGKRMLGWWRGMIMGITVFAAFATPSADPLSMLALASPIWVLFFAAVGISLLNDRRRLRRNPDAGLSDEEASHVDLGVETVGSAEAVTASAPAVASPAPVASVPVARGEQVDDDIT
ncbi:twin-arginine translocase subunit TatC [Kitasatospora sp. NPDC052896]|uniref:twin-arginine translocase subunit TatC n=1 Tax=Kitasatospora sp. NPDC052896 TaxID=3364061 RepID=UPI0037C810B2